MAIVPKKRYKKTLLTKKKILDCAYDLFIKYGFDQVTVDDICNICEITKGTFYHHFNTKDDLVCIALNNRLDTYLESHFNYDESEDYSKQLSDLISLSFTFFKSTGKAMIRKATETLTKTNVDVDSALYERCFLNNLNRLIERGIKENRFSFEASSIEIYSLLRSVLSGAMVMYAIQNDILDSIVDWNKIISDQIISLIKNNYP